MIERYRGIIENRLQELLKESKHELVNIIYDAMQYSVFTGGKRLRPLLLLGACELVSNDMETNGALDYACALEMIHTYSCIHDDLPAMDDDAYRRGMLTSHMKFGDGMAILAGDGLLNLAFEVMAECCETHFSKANVRAMKEIAKASGVLGMIGGQVLDLMSENKKIEKNTLLYIHENKTAALIRASVYAGAILGETADESFLSTVWEAGTKLGLAFQIQDDVLDVTSTTEQLGKPVGSDAENNKATYVSVFGLKQAQEDALQLSREAMTLFMQLEEKVSRKNTLLLALVNSLTNRQK